MHDLIFSLFCDKINRGILLVHHADYHVLRVHDNHAQEAQRMAEIEQNKRWVWPEVMVQDMRRIITEEPRIMPRNMVLELIKRGHRVPPLAKFSYKVVKILICR